MRKEKKEGEGKEVTQMDGTYKPCDQTRCAFKKGGHLENLCPDCPTCGAPPHELDSTDTCDNCWCCRGDEGYIRKGTPKGMLEAEKEKEKEKEIIVTTDGIVETPKENWRD